MHNDDSSKAYLASWSCCRRPGNNNYKNSIKGIEFKVSKLLFCSIRRKMIALSEVRLSEFKKKR